MYIVNTVVKRLFYARMRVSYTDDTLKNNSKIRFFFKITYTIEVLYKETDDLIIVSDNQEIINTLIIIVKSFVPSVSSHLVTFGAH